MKLSSLLTGICLFLLGSAAFAQVDHPIYTDSLVNGWQNWSWATVNTDNSTPLHAGTRSIAITAGAWQAFYLHRGALDTTPYANLVFWIHGGTTGGQRLQVKGLLSDVEQPAFALSPLVANTWQQVTIPLSSLNAANNANLTGFWIQEASGTAQPTFYIDDVVLTAVPPPANVTVSVNAASALRTIDPRLFGINTAIWDNQFDTQTTRDLLTEMGNVSLRFPGGSASDDYHWATNVSGNNTWQWATSFDKFANVALPTGAQVFITVNYGSGTPAEAADWVRYSNITKGWGFKYWEVGNENYGTWENDINNRPHDPQTYATRFKDFYTQMKAVDPTIRIGCPIVIGEDSSVNYTDLTVTNPRTGSPHHGWTPVMLTTMNNLGVIPDFVAYHRYEQGPGGENDAVLLQAAKTWANDAADLRQQLVDYLGAAAANVELTITENNSVYTDPGKQSTSLVNGLFYADSLSQVMKTEFKAFLWWDLRNGQDSSKNNSPSLYGWRMYGDYGIVTSAVPAGPADRYPTFYLAKLMKNFARGGDQVVSATSDYPGLSAYAVKTAAGGVNVLLINKHPSLNLPTTITLSGYTPLSTATVYSYGKPQDTAAQTGTGSADIAQATIGVPGATLSYTTTSYSATVIAFGAPGTLQPPAAPTGLTASMISNSQINLVWTDTAVNETGFKIERSTDQANWSQIAATAANGTAYSNTGLNSTTTYYYRVRAYNSAGDSAWSNISSATTPTPPAAPTNLTATATSTSQINLAWTDNSTDETGFRVERSTDQTTWTLITTTAANIKTYSNTGLSPGTRYYYRVSSYKTAAISNPASASATTWAATPPTGVTATVLSSTSIRVNWTDASNNETGFKIEASTDGGTTWIQVATAAANATTATITGLTGNTSYRFRVKAYTALGDSPNSAASTAVTTTYLPPAPSALTATVISNYQINLAWTDNSANESGFKVERSADGGATWTQIAQLAANTRTYNNTGLTFGTNYSYRVCGYNATSENGAYSNVVTATTFSNPPTAPTALTASVISTSQINLAWTDNSSDETGFKIERSADGGVTWTQVTTVAANVKTYSNTGRSAGTAYSYRVSAYSAAATSAPTNTITATTWAAMPPTTITGTVVSSTSIRVNWTDASSNETGFEIDASTDSGTTWTQVATAAANATSYTVTGLVPNTSYRFRLRAYNALGKSPNSSSSTAITTTYLPAEPSVLTATPTGNYQINLAWNDNSANETGFKIERSTDAGVTWAQIATVAANIKTYNNTGLTFGTTYSYRVRAYNSTNENGAYSNVASATTLSNPPVAPSALTATAASASQIDLAWSDNSSDETGFKVERSADGGVTWAQIATVGAGIRTCSSTGLAAGTAYAYRVSASNAAATSGPSSTASATTWAAMPPTTVTATVLSSTSIQIKWTDASNNETSFTIWERSPWAGSYVAVATTAANAVSYTRSGLTRNTLYSYYVTANNALGESPNSNTASATTTYLPTAPSALTASVISNYQINLAWTDNSANESGFKIERSVDGGTSWTQVGTVAANIKAYSNTGLTFGTTYSYRVRGYNATSEDGANSNVATATTFSNPPVAPTALTATVVSTSQINLTWADNSSDESGFKIERSADGGVTWTQVTTAAANVKTYSNTGLSAGTAYSYRVSASNAAATSAPTAVATATTWTAMPPTNVTATVASSTSMTVRWADASDNEGGFRIDISSDGGTTWLQGPNAAANAVSRTVTGLTPNTSYRFRVKAYTALGDSPNSAASTAVTTTYLPPAPSALTATVISNYQINLAWTDASSNESGFKIERSSDGGASWTQIGTTLANIKTYNNTGLSPGTAYSYRVYAYNSTNENGSYSNVISATTFSNPPIAPTTLTATVVSASQINLAWTDNSSDETGFKVDRSGDGGATWTQITTVGAGIRTYNNTGLAAGTAYSFRVSAYNAAATSTPSNTASGTTWAATPPTGVTATALSSTSIRVNWTDASSNETSFKLEQSSDAGVTWTLAATPAANAVTYTLTGLTPNTAYRYRLRACSALGESPNSTVVSITTPYVPAAPSALTATAASAAQINLAWTDNSANESGFKIDRSTDGGITWTQIATVGAGIRIYSNTGLAGGTSYRYRVRAYNATNENSAYSNVVVATTMPAAPTGLTATALAGAQIRLAWSNLAGESGYLIERSPNGTTWTQVGSVAADVTTYTNTGLTAGTRYYYRIRAYNSSGNGSYSTAVNALAIQ